MAHSASKSSSRLPLYLVTALLAAVTLAFLFAFVTTTETEIEARSQATAELNPDSYIETVSKLLDDTNPANGARLIEQYGCVACHREGAVNKVAPSFVGIAERAATRRPPLTAVAYLYESITNPTAYVVEGYNPAMPQNYPQRLSDRDLGDIIAYLLTSEAE